MDVEIISGSTYNLINPAIVNSYSALQVPSYWRALDFLSSNLASFPRQIFQNEMKYGQVHALDAILSRRANPMQTSHNLFRQWFFDGEHYGNGYIFIRRDPTTNP